MTAEDDEEERLRSVPLQRAQSILITVTRRIVENFLEYSFSAARAWLPC